VEFDAASLSSRKRVSKSFKTKVRYLIRWLAGPTQIEDYIVISEIEQLGVYIPVISVLVIVISSLNSNSADGPSQDISKYAMTDMSADFLCKLF
jgi:hypothetical protein